MYGFNFLSQLVSYYALSCFPSFHGTSLNNKDVTQLIKQMKLANIYKELLPIDIKCQYQMDQILHIIYILRSRALSDTSERSSSTFSINFYHRLPSAPYILCMLDASLLGLPLNYMIQRRAVTYGSGRMMRFATMAKLHAKTTLLLSSDSRLGLLTFFEFWKKHEFFLIFAQMQRLFFF